MKRDTCITGIYLLPFDRMLDSVLYRRPSRVNKIVVTCRL